MRDIDQILSPGFYRPTGLMRDSDHTKSLGFQRPVGHMQLFGPVFFADAMK